MELESGRMGASCDMTGTAPLLSVMTQDMVILFHPCPAFQWFSDSLQIIGYYFKSDVKIVDIPVCIAIRKYLRVKYKIRNALFVIWSRWSEDGTKSPYDRPDRAQS